MELLGAPGSFQQLMDIHNLSNILAYIDNHLEILDELMTRLRQNGLKQLLGIHAHPGQHQARIGQAQGIGHRQPAQ
jgi:hypothetical protein